MSLLKARSGCPASLCWKAGPLNKPANTTTPTAASLVVAAVPGDILVVTDALVEIDPLVEIADMVATALPVVIADQVVVTAVLVVATHAHPAGSIS